VIGPSPGMADLVTEYGFGCVTKSFASDEAAALLNSFTPGEIERLREASERAAQQFNADTEMAKLVDLYYTLLPERN